MSKQTPATRLRARELLAESERLEKDLATLIDQLTEFTDELQAQLKAERDDTTGGEHGPGADGSLVQ